MPVRGIRGAITIESNTKDEIIKKTTEMLKTMVSKNDITVEDIVSVFFSVTEDIDAEFPAVAARKLGWNHTPMLCTREIPVPGSLSFCIRVLLHLNSGKTQEEMKHVYLYEAKRLRPDLDANGVSSACS